MRAPVLLLLVAIVAGVACAPKVQVPPRIDLTGYGTVGMIAFDASDPGSDGDMADLATNQFMAVVQGAQPGVPIVELGDSKRVLASVKRDRLDHEAIKAIGERYDVDVLIVGAFTSEKAKPRFSMQSFTSVQAGAKLEGVLSARIYQTRSAATVWTNAARGYQDLASVNLDPSFQGTLPRVSGQDLDTAEQKLVRSLVVTLTQDFRSRWVRQ